MSLREQIQEYNQSTAIRFDPEDHIYTLDGQRLRSVTKFLKTFFQAFDAEAMAERMARSEHRPEYFGRSPADILDEWNRKNEKSLARGILLHDEIDRYLTGHMDGSDSTSPLFRAFLNYWEQESPAHLASEQILFDQETGLAGTIDEIACMGDEILLCDWKTSKSDIHKHYNKSAFAPIQHLPASAYTRYALQLNIYAFLFYRTFGIKVSHLHVVMLRKSGPEKVEIPRMHREVASLLKLDQVDY